MANTLVKISTVTVGGGGASTIDFTSIPATYTDLCLKISSRSARTATGTDWKMEFNGVTTAYTYRRIYGDGAAAYSDTASTGQTMTDSSANATASIFGNAEIYIPNYASSNYKSWSADTVSENNATGANSAYPNLYVGLWSDTAAITSITIKSVQATTFVQYTSATLYGISNYSITNPGGKATGGIVTQDSNYWYHTFTTSGTFTPTQSLTADYLVVAGGGGGGTGFTGQDTGGGGGAGGLRCTVGTTGGGGSLESALSLTAQAYTVTIGAGGASNTSGSNSVFSSITSTAGGKGAGNNSTDNGSTGGAGGGGRGTGLLTGRTGGAGTANQGFAGGTFISTSGNAYGGGGGGGTSAVGSNGASTFGGAGGAGVTTSISGTSTVYAGGGGGGASDYGGGPYSAGTGGTGGGGNGGSDAIGSAATVNSGGGGGGGGSNGSNTRAGGAGGSGIVIVRYAQ